MISLIASKIFSFGISPETRTGSTGTLFYDSMMGNEQIREKLLKRYSEFADIIAKKIGERTDSVSPEYLSWLLLLLSDGLFIHQTLRNPSLNVSDFIRQSEQFLSVQKECP